VEKGNWAGHDIIQSKDHTQASIGSDHKFYYLTYNDASDFKSGYSESYINFNDKNSYQNSCNNPTIKKNEKTPLIFADDVEIEKLKFISGTKYAYYKIYSKNKNKYYFGLIDIKLNKILYNLEEEITEFIPNPYSEGYEMLAITKNSAYKVCIFKSGNTCQECSNIILDTSGNQCNTGGCSSGKIKFMPEGICIDKNLCDLNIYELNSEETECGLCSYINSQNNSKNFLKYHGNIIF
jgi:hypothetical protein